jgi:hypothetical protein
MRNLEQYMSLWLRLNVFVAEWLVLLLRNREPRVNILDRGPAILTNVFRDFPQSAQANAGIVP